MEDVRNALKPVKWSSMTRRAGSENTRFPVIVKPTLAASKAYEISEDPILLHQLWVTQRIVAQNLEDEGTYVVGPQMDIPSEYTGTFNYRRDQKGNDEIVQVYNSVKEIAGSMPEVVFPLERIIVYPVTGEDCSNAPDKVKSVIFQPREMLSVVEKQDVHTIAAYNRIFGGKSKFKHVLVQCVTFRVESTGETINVPLTARGKFSTKSFIPVHGRELDFQDILASVDLPINLTTCRNCPRSPLDEHILRPSTRLRMTNVEEHEVILGVTLQEKVIEFAVDQVDFILPEALNAAEDNEQEIAYQTALQRFLMECEIKNSPINIKDYRKSIRNHQTRTMRRTNPKPLSQMSSSRVYRYTGRPAVQNGISAIQLLINSKESVSSNHVRRTSLPDAQPRQRAPLPAPPDEELDVIPPLPPRNSGAVMRGSSPFSSRRSKSARVKSYAGEFWDELPSRPPPMPPVDSRVKSNSTAFFSQDTEPNLFTTGFDEQVWESFDENCLRKLRDDRRKKEDSASFTSYQNVDHNKSDSPIFNNCLNGSLGDVSESSVRPKQICYENHSFNFDNSSPVNSQPFVPPLPPYPGARRRSESSPQFGNPPKLSSTDNEVAEIISRRDNTGNSPFHATVTAPSPDITSETSVTKAYPDPEEFYLPMSPAHERKEPTLDRKDSLSSESSSDSKHSPEVPASPSKRSSTSSDTTASTEGERNQSSKSDNFHITQYSLVSDDSSGHHLSLSCNYVSSPDNWEPPEDLKSLSVSEVADSLRFIGMNEDTVDWFKAEKVDGELLCSIDGETLTQHFRLSPFQNKKLTMFVNGWRPKLE